ncbi:TPA: transcription modulator YdgT, partial [Klebsiella pneumoniae]|nr:transcription modulator YdgT [Klebsiella pneumoniae]
MNADNIQRNNSDYKMDTKMTVL